MTDATTRATELREHYGRADLCLAAELCDRHPAGDVAAMLVAGDLSAVDLTYGELRERSERLAAGLAGLGVGPGSRVATLLPRTADLLVTVVAVLRLGAVYVPLFTAFAPQAIALRLTASGTTVVITDESQRPKLDPGEDIPADAPWTVVTVGSAEWDRIAGASPTGAPAAVVGPDGAMVQLYTSGTTGRPKGVIVPAKALASMVAYQELALDVTADDVFWNAADPGWAYGLYYALLAPLATGRRTLLLNAGFSARSTWDVLGRFGVTAFAAAPTVYRGLRASGIAPPEGLRLRTCSSAGEPLNPDLVTWGREVLGVEIRDHYGQTELGMVVANAWHPDLRAEIRPGSMGRALPGFRVAVLADDGSGQEVPPDTPGRVALDVPASPLLWFEGYAGGVRGDRFSEDGRWYLTGDAGRADADGHLYFSARDDDVIIMAGYRIGPFDVESVLSTHPAVAEVAVVGMPDELRGEVVEAFVVLREGVEATPDLPDELARLVRTRYAAHAYPRRVHLVDALPKTPSGKVQRFLLRQQGR